MQQKYTFELKETAHLGREVAVGSFFSLGSQVVLLLVQVLTTSLLARLLLPEDFGLVALSTTFTGLIIVFRDLGLSMATLQKKDLTHEQVSNLFWLNLSFSVFLAVVVTASAPFLANFYKDQRLLPITIVSGLSLVVAGFTVQHQALLRRKMKFKILAIVDVCSKTLGSGISILWAWCTHSLWALVWMPIMSAGFYAIAMWVFCRWRPSPFQRGVGTMSLLHFGKDMLHYGIINYFARNADNFIVGKISGATELGYYSRSYSLMLMPVGQLVAPLTGVSVSALSKLQSKPEEYKKYYMGILKVLSVVSFFLVSQMYVFHSEIIDIFLGSQWEGAKHIFSILCFAAFWQPVLSTAGWVMTSLGHTKRMVQWGYINSLSLVLIFLIGGLLNGAVGVAYFYAVYMWLIVIPCFGFTLYDSPILLRELLCSFIRPLVFTLVATVPVILFKNSLMLYFSGWTYRLVIPLIVSCIIWIMYLLIDRSLLAMFKKIIKRELQ